VADSLPREAHSREDGALLAGVCAGLARRLGWNAWALRALFVVFLFVQTIATGVVYVLLALLLPRFGGRSAEGTPESDKLKSSELGARGKRIEELERKFRELEREQDGR
jgi:phage shock protein PspC (stress-responsive transcriptional regulator)